MRLLLDTHIWIWSLLEAERLHQRVRRALQSAENELWLSSISVWELLILVDKGRVVLEMDPGAWLDEAMTRAPLKEAPITHEIARGSRRTGLEHADPADAFLAATARVLDLTLVTSDRRLLSAPGLSVLSNE